MNLILAKTHAALDANLGRCPKCMRQSFLAAFIAWTLAIAVWVIIGNDAITDTTLIIAICLTALWTAHLIAYAVRSAANSERLQGTGFEMKSRREIIPTFARALGAMALATVFPREGAFAQNCCDCSKCGSGQVCCKTANGCCGCFPAVVQC